MSILIKNMEMPGTGRYLIVYPDGRVVDTDIDGESQCIIPGSKAVPVPPHGRLIDADALMENAQYKGTHDIVTAWDIVAAPTIIPASDKEAGKCCSAV